AGWTDVPGFRTYVRFLRAEALVQRFSTPGLAGLVRMAGPLALYLMDVPGRRRRSTTVRLDPVELFDGRFDALWDRAKAHLGISVRRTAEYLNWRYVAMPTHRHERMAAVTSAGEVVGYVVWRAVDAGDRPIVRVLDVVWDPRQGGVGETLLL